MVNKYKKYWIGKCIDEGASVNLEKGKLYLLKDIAGNQKHYNVSPFISNSDSFVGSYTGNKFKVLEDVTEAINAMPHEEGVFRYEMHVGIVRMVARERGMNFIEAQEYLISDGTLAKPVVDSNGQPLVTHASIYEPKSVREPDFEVKAQVHEKYEKASNEKDNTKKDTKEVKTNSTAQTPDKTAKISTETAKSDSSKSNTSNKPKEAPKQKFVQKGLFNF